jgi:hypothetical protein
MGSRCAANPSYVGSFGDDEDDICSGAGDVGEVRYADDL